MPNKTTRIVVRVTRAELRAVHKLATNTGHATVAEMVRARVVRPALEHDPKQHQLPLAPTG